MKKDHVFKQITEDNYELMAAFIAMRPAWTQSHIGDWITWEDIRLDPGDFDIQTEGPQGIDPYLTVTDSHLADRKLVRG